MTYVNESSARVVFVEHFRDASNQSLSSKLVTLQAAGDNGDTVTTCIECPHTASVRNIDYFDASPSTPGVPPADLTFGDFSCGDNITFTFKSNHTVSASIATP